MDGYIGMHVSPEKHAQKKAAHQRFDELNSVVVDHYQSYLQRSGDTQTLNVTPTGLKMNCFVM